MRNLLTTQDQNFYRELILKEAYTRLAWKMKYSGEYPISSSSRRSKSIGLFNPPSVSEVTLPPVVQTQKPKTPVVTRGVLSEAPLMRPVSSQTKASLYAGLSNDGKGRRLYLKKRTEQGPEEKYEHPILSSWDYGWRLGDYEMTCKTPGNGRSEIVRNTFYARNGIFNIPSATDQCR
ncbi:protein ATP6V1FNB isoform X1 [Triplophysa dalaica]|uniref:protein ATP6V1FNB isoform X1 n=1 Tax=Triplophysa dalaica TaxID=1582913 RepID=UPI0024DFB4A2|nr:protein ATP6V1FNB isoform X1 [Triplophysa dalaica]